MWRRFGRRAYSQRLSYLTTQWPEQIESTVFGGSVYQRFYTPNRNSDISTLVRFSDSNFGNPLASFQLRSGYGTSAAQVVSNDESELSGLEEFVELANEVEAAERVVGELDELHSLPFLGQEKRIMVGGMGRIKYAHLKRKQIKMETDAWEDAAKEYDELINEMCEQKLAPNLPYVKSLLLGWFEPLRNVILAEQELVKRSSGHKSYIAQLPADMLAVITMHKMMGLLMSTGGKGQILVLTAAVALGEAVEHETRIYKILQRPKFVGKKSKGNDESKVSDAGKKELSKDEELLRKKVVALMRKQKLHKLRNMLESTNDEHWCPEAHAKIGSRLIQLLIETAYIQPPVDYISDTPPDIRPAFTHVKKGTSNDQQGKKKYGLIECDPLVRNGLENTARHMVIPYMPMLVPPLKWRGYDKGAYFFLPSFFMRTHGARHQRDAVKRADPDQLKPIFEALDTLGSTKWRVNRKVFAVVDRLWTSGGCIAGLVDREDIALPEEPNSEIETEIRKWKWKVREIKKENSERHSERCSIELKLSVARKMLDEEGFFYPHNVDFRGRAYPMHPHLNHLGSDVSRGILEFAEGRPLGESGLRWLMIHMANQFGGGVDKLPFDDRVKFTESHVDEILDSADQPLEGKRWWLNAEDPFQCLATCINLAEALRSPSPHKTISHLPIHQDGSCNGLQHYAALGRDKLGAASVNLVNVKKPADVYTRIAERVVDIMERDSKDDPASNKEALFAKALIDQVDRKLVKQTVMTSVYGVTFVGARDQIMQRFKERGNIDNPYMASCYVAKVTLKALDEIFDGARTIMSWLGECAKLIASQNQTVRWTTPLGLPVVQPYRKLNRHLVKTSLQTLTLKKEGDKVMPRRQRTAFPPNFVHSLDGSHMMMTAIACGKAGMNFAGVHDSYWTHACDVDELNRILREKFVELYESPILEKLLEEFQRTYPTLVFPPVPDRGDFDLKQVLKSQYFFN